MASSNRRAMILLLVLSGTIISICMGLRQSLGLFMRPMTLEAGISAATFGFATALGLIGLFNTVGTCGFGLLGARYSQKRLLALIYLLRTLFIIAFLLMPISATTTLIFAAAMGMLWLGVSPLVTGIIARVFGLTHFGTLYGVVFLSHQVGSFFGAWMGGLVFGWYGSYNAAWGALIVIGLSAFTLQWLMDDRPPPVRAAARGPASVAAAA